MQQFHRSLQLARRMTYRHRQIEILLKCGAEWICGYVVDMAGQRITKAPKLGLGSGLRLTITNQNDIRISASHCRGISKSCSQNMQMSCEERKIITFQFSVALHFSSTFSTVELCTTAPAYAITWSSLIHAHVTRSCIDVTVSATYIVTANIILKTQFFIR
jgi:hypothetical protein